MTEFEIIVANAYRLPSLTTPAHEEALLAAILRTDKAASRTLRLPGQQPKSTGVSASAPPPSAEQTRIAVMGAIQRGARTNIAVRQATKRGESAVGYAIKALISAGMVKRRRVKNPGGGATWINQLYLTPKGAGVLAAAADAKFKAKQ